jgi:hypothetical protein
MKMKENDIPPHYGQDTRSQKSSFVAMVESPRSCQTDRPFTKINFFSVALMSGPAEVGWKETLQSAAAVTF